MWKMMKKMTKKQGLLLLTIENAVECCELRYVMISIAKEVAGGAPEDFVSTKCSVNLATTSTGFACVGFVYEQRNTE